MTSLKKSTSQPPQDKPVLPEHDFYHYFGRIIPDIFKFFRQEVKWFQRTQTFLGSIDALPSHFYRANAIIEQFIPIWKTLNSYSDGYICFHIYSIFYSMLRDPEYNSLSKYDRNVLLWTVLLHDICKRGSPVVSGKDPIHPFKSAWQCLYYFNDIFKWVNLSKRDFEEWDSLFEEGYVMKYGMEIQNHQILPVVKNFLDTKLQGKEFEKEILYHVMLHQSIPTISRFPHMALLLPLETEVPKYFDKRSFNVFRIFLRHDSFSYLIYCPQLRKKYGAEIDENIEFIAEFVMEPSAKSPQKSKTELEKPKKPYNSKKETPFFCFCQH